MHALALLLVLSGIEIRSPREFQVVQRGPNGAGRVVVEGTCGDDVEKLGARVGSSWRALELEDLAGPEKCFHGVLEVPAGGWYSLAIARAEAENGLAEVQRFGVGEVFLVAGQSNSTNYGEETTTATEDGVVSFDGEAWWLAADPLPGVQDHSQGGSPWPTCGDLLRRALGVPVGFASVGFGGTSLRQWQKGAELGVDGGKIRLYDGLLARARALGEFRAILWHQGESDAMAGMKAEEYVSLFSKLRGELAKDLGRESTWIVAHATFVPGQPKEKLEGVRAGQTELWKRKLALQGPDTDDLLGAMRHSRDHIHFSRAGLVAHGTRWFAHVWAGCFAEPR